MADELRLVPGSDKWKTLRHRALTDLFWFCDVVLGYGSVVPMTHKAHLLMCRFAERRTGHAALDDAYYHLITVPRNVGKCQAADAEVLTGDGSYRRVADLAIGDMVWSASDNLVPQWGRIRAIEPQPPEPIYAVRTRSGRTIRVSGRHPFRCLAGFVEALHLRIGARVAVARQTPEPLMITQLTEDEAAFLGYMVGDGACGRAAFTNADPAVLADFRRCVKALGGQSYVRTKPGTPAVQVETRRLRPLLAAHGLKGMGSYEKRVPVGVFRASTRAVGAFLRAVYSCDGTVEPQGPVTYSTVNRDLALDIQRLLLRFGVVAYVRPKNGRYRGQPHRSYLVWLADAEARRAFRAIGFVGAKQKRLAARKACLCRPNIDTVPPEWRSLIDPKTMPNGMNTLRRAGVRIDNTYSTTREKFRDAVAVAGRTDLLPIAEWFWDEVVGTEPQGEETTYAIDVAETGTYCISDVLTHNSTIVTRGRAIQLALGYPGISILIANEREKNAVDFLREIKGHFESNDFLRALFPERIPPDFRATQWSETSATLPRPTARPEPTFLATGVGAAITGLHPDYAFIDDMISNEAAENARAGSFLLVEKANRWCNQLVPLVKRGEPHCGITLIGTMWWYGDSYEHIEKAFGYEAPPQPFSLSYRTDTGAEGRIPLVTGLGNRIVSGVYRRGDLAVFRRSIIEDNASFFPERWPLDELAKFRVRDPVLYAANMMNSPADEVTASFKSDWLRYYERPHEDTIGWRDGPETRYVQQKDLDRVMSVDPAFTERGSDASRAAVVVTGSTATGKRFVLEALARRLAADSLVDLIVTTALRYKPRKLLIERVAQQAAFIALVKHALAKTNLPLPIEEVTPAGRNKDVRILQLESYFQRGDILFHGSQHDILEEYREFPRGRNKDLLDALAYQPPFWLRPQEGSASFTANAEERIAKEMEALSRRLGHPVGLPRKQSEPGRVRPDGSRRF